MLNAHLKLKACILPLTIALTLSIEAVSAQNSHSLDEVAAAVNQQTGEQQYVPVTNGTLRMAQGIASLARLADYSHPASTLRTTPVEIKDQVEENEKNC